MNLKVYKPKPCKWCKEKFTPERPIQMTCGYICAIAYAKDRQSKKLRSDNKTKLRGMMTKGGHLKELQEVVNQIVKYIDMGLPCVSSGRPLQSIRNSGHYFAVGSCPAIRFHLLNLHTQGVSDNMYKGGKPIEYLEGVRKMYGPDYAEEMQGLKLRYPELKLSIPEIIEARQKALQILKRLKKEERTYGVQERIDLRRGINDELGIYK